MPQQQFDHSAFIAGRLSEYQKVGWAEQVVLGQGARSIWLMQAKHIDHGDGRRGFELQLEKYKRDTNTSPFGKAEFSLVLKEDVLAKLFDYLQRQQALGEVDLGSGYLAIPLGKSTMNFSKKNLTGLATIFRGLFEAGQLESLLTSGALTKESLQNIGAASQHLRYKTAVAELRQLLQTENDEKVYQKWFEAHPWICGTNYVGKVDIRRIGLHKITDLVMQTTDGYLDLFELKRPDAEVLREDPSHKNFYFSASVSSAISQCANYIVTTEANRYQLAQEEKALFLKPRARIIIGRSNTWDQPKHNVLRMLNGSLHFIEVWTYDQLLGMADQMVKLYETPASQTTEEAPPNDETPPSDIPF